MEDTLQTVADHYRIRLEDLIKANRLSADHAVQAGKTLEIPLSAANVTLPAYRPYLKQV
ncbi:LysM peptidoglycan-binding domain-containing protein [Cohnella ginsengisoli]|uniref:LysM peptidoglycan-binding domain-containing protein n=1 Tax=Cohnella ginsengisoli TaxID=425004 RepID=A0A9X4KLU9_9BACL|nr:LysM peptidoglycan-binding domain-containing protein [Cohnella ginsengisoli]MDG0793794.1 LysM peptidoglycan-binding domain-containing protein [Cohnella ginsengisoli]